MHDARAWMCATALATCATSRAASSGARGRARAAALRCAGQSSITSTACRAAPASCTARPRMT